VAIEEQVFASLSACGTKLAIEALGNKQRFPADHHTAAITDEIPRKELVQDVAGVKTWGCPGKRAARCVNDRKPAVDEACPFPSRDQGLKLAFNVGGSPKVIRVDERDEICTGALPPAISGRSHSRIVLPDDLDTRILRGMLLDDSNGVVARAVIDNDNLELLMRLRSDAPERFIDC
jgi:hypothetical protein